MYNHRQAALQIQSQFRLHPVPHSDQDIHNETRVTSANGIVCVVQSCTNSVTLGKLYSLIIYCRKLLHRLLLIYIRLVLLKTAHRIPMQMAELAEVAHIKCICWLQRWLVFYNSTKSKELMNLKNHFANQRLSNKHHFLCNDFMG